MSIWKNTEVRRTALWLLLATAVCSVAAALLYPICGLLTLGLGAVCGAIWYGSTRRRYRELECMSRDIDRILHGQEQQMLPQQEEGELAILRSEIGKMTVRLRENAQRQQEERVRLADAMADISHQLRTPLTAMRLTLSLLEQENLTPQRRLALMRELKKLTGRMEWLVEALLKMAQLDAGTVVFHPQDTTAAELVRRAAEPLEVPMEVRSIRFTAQAGEERLTCDVPWSTEALGNILKNCMEHAASWVQVTARETAIFTEITVQDDEIIAIDNREKQWPIARAPGGAAPAFPAVLPGQKRRGEQLRHRPEPLPPGAGPAERHGAGGKCPHRRRTVYPAVV